MEIPPIIQGPLGYLLTFTTFGFVPHADSGLKVCILGKACLAPIHSADFGSASDNFGSKCLLWHLFGDEQINIFRSTVLLENLF
jgi:hypothetical protein